MLEIVEGTNQKEKNGGLPASQNKQEINYYIEKDKEQYEGEWELALAPVKRIIKKKSVCKTGRVLKSGEIVAMALRAHVEEYALHVAGEAAKIALYSGRNTIKSRDVEAAVQLIEFRKEQRVIEEISARQKEERERLKASREL